jgi:hypothetical protein
MAGETAVWKDSMMDESLAVLMVVEKVDSMEAAMVAQLAVLWADEKDSVMVGVMVEKMAD